MQQGALAERVARLLVTLPPDEAIRRPEDARGDYVARCTREARSRLQLQSGLAGVEGSTGRLVLASSGRSSRAPEACPHCWKVPKRYACEGLRRGQAGTRTAACRKWSIVDRSSLPL